MVVKLTMWWGFNESPLQYLFEKETVMIKLSILISVIILCTTVYSDEYLGQLSSNLYDQNSVANFYDMGSPYKKNSVNKQFSKYGSPFSNQSVRNPFSTGAPRLYDAKGNYRGRLSTNQFDPDSISNRYGRFGSQYSPVSINNQFGAGSPYRIDSPTNFYGEGWKIIGSD